MQDLHGPRDICCYFDNDIRAKALADARSLARLCSTCRWRRLGPARQA
ncbi:hypothetical protein predicted by Glimmer/Critica [Bordetella petrii]|uniref:Uncharacterized protein n=1 Tax=Bordetella petrii (strain ATCC BAA-461 / DSM 12804 / CCUG 43448 / CIP 107267 / Se-1111R) TaxID=340100 RepID=A9IN87_BORPD|nr:hypothetical protein predicted by Glimmer/Critica [Bordetella petrii]